MILFSCSVENVIEILMEIVAFGDTVSFTMLILPVHYPWESPYLPVSSCVFKSFYCNVFFISLIMFISIYFIYHFEGIVSGIFTLNFFFVLLVSVC